jgi:hypothetical protein
MEYLTIEEKELIANFRRCTTDEQKCTIKLRHILKKLLKQSKNRSFFVTKPFVKSKKYKKG